MYVFLKVMELSAVELETQAAAILTNPPIRAGKDTVFKFYDEAYENC